jgi:site-specific recombinase XerD
LFAVPGDRLPATPEGAAMTTTNTTTELVPCYLDVTRLALASFLARYREPTLSAYKQDLAAFLVWCDRYDLQPLRVTRGQLEMYVRHLGVEGTRRPRSRAGSAPWPRSTSTR